MSLSDYQQKVDARVGQYKQGYWTPHEILARITEETGELARLINHVYGPKKKKDTEAEQEMGQEMVDIFYVIACLANRLNINLDGVR